MTIRGGDVITLSTGGVLELQSTGLPVTPGIAISVSGTTVTVTVSDSASGSTNYLQYKASGDTAWTDGGSRSGDGDIEVTDLTLGLVYVFVVYSTVADVVSTPSIAIVTTLAADEDADDSFYDDQLIDAASSTLAQYGEPMIYYPGGGGSRSITGIPTRRPYQTMDGTPTGNAPVTDVLVANNATTGISAAELNTGGDKLGIDVRIGETVQQRRITQLLMQDAGMIRVEVR